VVKIDGKMDNHFRLTAIFVARHFGQLLLAGGSSGLTVAQTPLERADMNVVLRGAAAEKLWSFLKIEMRHRPSSIARINVGGDISSGKKKVECGYFG
jgi:hypothetical protein